MAIIKSNIDLQKEISQLHKEIVKLKFAKSQTKKITDSLIDATDLAHYIFEDAGIGIAIIDKNFKIVKYNKTFNNIYGYSHDELLNMTYLDFIPEERKAKVIQIFDVVLMDLKMPVLGGIEATKQIREFNSDLPIIAQTAFIYNNEKGLCLMAGCNAYITKPTTLHLLLETIDKYLTNGI